MDRDPASILDIVLACRRLTRFISGRTREDLDRDDLLLYAVLHATALIGEAATRLSPEFRQDHPEIPWREIIGTRNRIIHGYDTVKIDIIWDIAATKVELLLGQLEPLLPPEPAAPPDMPRGDRTDPNPSAPAGHETEPKPIRDVSDRQEIREDEQKLAMLRGDAAEAFDELDRGEAIVIEGEDALADFIRRSGERAADRAERGPESA